VLGSSLLFNDGDEDKGTSMRLLVVTALLCSAHCEQKLARSIVTQKDVDENITY